MQDVPAEEVSAEEEDEETAAADACKIEHVISDETFAAVKKHYQYYKKA